MSKPLIAITGASSGIGRAAAEHFANAGYPVLLMARRLDQLQASNLKNSLCAEVDVNNLDRFAEAIKKAESIYGPVDALINNAGVMLLGDASVQNPAEWKQMFDVNVLGLLNGIHIVLKAMIQRQTGTIINISSVAGRKTFPNHSIYCGTKFAVHAITENIRQEVAGHNVRLITIAPGAVETELLSHTSSDKIKADYTAWKKATRGVLDPNDIARAILFAYEQPQNVCIREIVIAATRQDA